MADDLKANPNREAHHAGALPVIAEGGALEEIVTKTDVTKEVASMT